MINVSIINNKPVYGILSGNNTFQILKEDFEDIKNGNKSLNVSDNSIIDIVKPEIPVEPSPLCIIDIPLTTTDIPDIDAKITKILKLHHGNVLSTTIEIDGVVYQRLYNIYIERVSGFLTQSEYDAFSAPELGVIFDEKIVALFTNP